MTDTPPEDGYAALGIEPSVISEEDYAKLDVQPVVVPKTPSYNLNRLLKELPGDTKERKRESLQALLRDLPPEELAALRYKWSFWARDNQIAPPGEWTFWLLLAGRGFGKTRTGAEWVNERVELGLSKRIHLIAPTAADVRKVMVEGESGILAISPPWNRPHFEPSKLQLTWPNGAIAQMFSAEEPERLRGPQCDTIWADELCAWKNQQMTWDMAMFGFRLGNDPKACITTTPKPQTLLKSLVKDEATGDTAVVRGSTHDNKGNLAPKFYSKVVKDYEGTRLGRQELDAAILEDMPGALWNRANIDAVRIPLASGVLPMPSIIRRVDDPWSDRVDSQVEDVGFLRRCATAISKLVPEDLSRVVVAVDPNASNNEGSDEIGIVVAGKGVSGQGYVLADLSMKGSPNDWATTVIIGHDVFQGDRVIGEANQGGNMVEHTIASAAKFLRMDDKRASDYIAVTLVHATRGKVTRAEPVAALYEQKRITHVGTHAVLEDQMCLFTSDFDRKAMGYSPDRVDALVWALTHLFLEASDTGLLEFYQSEAMKKKQREKPGEKVDLIRLLAPPGVSTAYGVQGDKYSVDENGDVHVKRQDVKGLRSAGFCEYPPDA